MPDKTNLKQLFSDGKKTCKKAAFQGNLPVFVLIVALKWDIINMAFSF